MLKLRKFPSKVLKIRSDFFFLLKIVKGERYTEGIKVKQKDLGNFHHIQKAKDSNIKRYIIWKACLLEEKLQV